jgi:hypothetical protein
MESEMRFATYSELEGALEDDETRKDLRKGMGGCSASENSVTGRRERKSRRGEFTITIPADASD